MWYRPQHEPAPDVVTVRPGLVLAPGSAGGRPGRVRIPGLARRRRGRGAAGAGVTASYRLGKVGITWSMPVSANTRKTEALVGMTSRSSPPSARARLCAWARTPTPAEAQNWVRVRVHHERLMAAGGCFQQHRAQAVGVAGVDFFGCRHHGHAIDHLDGIPDACHLRPTSRPDAHDSAAIPGVWMELGPGGPAQNDEPAVPSTAGRIVPSRRQVKPG